MLVKKSLSAGGLGKFGLEFLLSLLLTGLNLHFEVLLDIFFSCACIILLVDFSDCKLLITELPELTKLLLFIMFGGLFSAPLLDLLPAGHLDLLFECLASALLLFEEPESLLFGLLDLLVEYLVLLVAH